MLRKVILPFQAILRQTDHAAYHRTHLSTRPLHALLDTQYIFAFEILQQSCLIKSYHALPLDLSVQLLHAEFVLNGKVGARIGAEVRLEEHVVELLDDVRGETVFGLDPAEQVVRGLRKPALLSDNSSLARQPISVIDTLSHHVLHYIVLSRPLILLFHSILIEFL